MKALLVRGPNDFSVVDRPDPIPTPDTAILRIHCTGICATDITTISGRSTVARFPMTPGHEFIAQVEMIEDGFEFGIGDWVTIYPTEGCGTCSACQEGKPNHCPDFKVWGVSRDGGAFAERMVVPVKQLLPVPERLRNTAGALIEPTAVAVHALRRARLEAGQRVVIIGTGSIGLLIAQAARAAGAAQVTLVDRLPGRRATAEALGFSDFMLTSNGNLATELSQAPGAPFDIVFDTVGTPATLEAAVAALRITGYLVVLGFPHGDEPLTLPYPMFYRKELSLILSRNYARDDFIEATRLLESGAIASNVMVTGTFPLSGFASALDALRQQPADHVKVLINPVE